MSDISPAEIRDTYAAFIQRQLPDAGDPDGILEGTLDVLDDIIAGRYRQ
jgi:hypothetical protein